MGKSPGFIAELESFSKSDLLQMPYFENIDAKKLVVNLRKGDTKMIPYIMPMFIMHIWLKTYANKF